MIKHNKKSEITVVQDEQSKLYAYLIDGVYSQQKTKQTEGEAKESGKKKLSEILNR